MPPAAHIEPYRLFFSSEGSQLPHIHVQRDQTLAKFWLRPAALASSSEFSSHELRRIEGIVVQSSNRFEGLGVNSSHRKANARAKKIAFTKDELTVVLADGRRLSVPLAWFPRLLHATSEQPGNYELLGERVGSHWPDLDEGLRVLAFSARVSNSKRPNTPMQLTSHRKLRRAW